MALTDGKIRDRLLGLWLPMIGGILAVKAIGVSDAYFIGQLGEKPLAAVSFTFPVVMTLISLAIGLSSGASSVLSQAIGGETDEEGKLSIIAGALGLSAIMSVLLGIIGALVIDFVFRLMGADDGIRGEAVAYMRIWFAGAIFLFLPIVINGVLRAVGDGVSPALLMTFIAVLNIAINPIFIFGLGPIPALEVQGAATATVIARAASLGAGLWLLARKDLLRISPSSLKKGVAYWREIARIGGPAALSTSLNPFSIAIVTAAVATIGESAVAGFGVATKIQSIALAPILALSAASAPLAGQNSGAGKEARTDRMLLWCFGISAAWATLIAVFFWLFGDALAARFSSEDGPARFAGEYLAVVPLTLGGYGVVIAASAAFNGLGRSVTALILAGGRALLLIAPAAWIGIALGGFAGGLYGIAAANVVAGLVAFVYVRRHDLTVRGPSGGPDDPAEHD